MLIAVHRYSEGYVSLNLFTILLSDNPVAVESINEGAHHVSRRVGHQSFIQHFLDNQK